MCALNTDQWSLILGNHRILQLHCSTAIITKRYSFAADHVPARGLGSGRDGLAVWAQCRAQENSVKDLKAELDVTKTELLQYKEKAEELANKNKTTGR